MQHAWSTVPVHIFELYARVLNSAACVVYCTGAHLCIICACTSSAKFSISDPFMIVVRWWKLINCLGNSALYKDRHAYIYIYSIWLPITSSVLLMASGICRPLYWIHDWSIGWNVCGSIWVWPTGKFRGPSNFLDPIRNPSLYIGSTVPIPYIFYFMY